VSYLVDDVQLVVSELATNAILHARTPFTVTLDGFDDLVFLTVMDGSVMDGSGSPPARVTARPMMQGCRGLAVPSHSLSVRKRRRG
jgi:hypothetical protein